MRRPCSLRSLAPGRDSPAPAGFAGRADGLRLPTLLPHGAPTLPLVPHFENAPVKIQSFLEHHGIAHNPFSEEDAQTDPVFKQHCISRTYHPSWDKIYGDPASPATAVVFGEKGAGKTALRLQIVRHLAQHNEQPGAARTLVIEYDDFNPFLDRFRDHLGGRRRRADRALAEWKLWDHMDAILSLGVTRIVDLALGKTADSRTDAALVQQGLANFDRLQARDLLLLTACYDQSLAEPFVTRWSRLRRKLRYRNGRAYASVCLAVLVTAGVAGLVGWQQKWDWLETPWPYLAIAAAWLPWLWRAASCWRKAWQVQRQVRSLVRPVGALRKLLMRFPTPELVGQPLPNKERTDDRFELLQKFQAALKTLGFPSLVVLVDRVDEPHLVNGATDQMRALIWPMLDNKFLKHPGIGFKLLLPIELARFIEREDQDFYQRARLDKQNLVPSLVWTGEALYDVANDRLRACAVTGRSPTLSDLLGEEISPQRLIDALRSLRVPRHTFKFLYRLLMAHAGAHTDQNPVWRIPSGTFESTLALYQRDQDAFDRGVGAG